MKHFFRLAAAVPPVKVGAVSFNCREILNQYREAQQCGAAAVVFPELAVTGCSCGDLFFQDRLLDAAENGLQQLAEQTGGTILITGVPVRSGSRIFSAAAILQNGKIRGTVYRRTFGHDRRNFSTGNSPLQLFRAGELLFGVEIGADLHAVRPPSAELASAGAQVIFRPASEKMQPGCSFPEREFIRAQSARLGCAYLSSNAGVHESTSDGVYAGKSLIVCSGTVTAENEMFQRTGSLIYTDFNCRWTENFRRSETLLSDAMPQEPAGEILLDPVPESADLRYCKTTRTPFLPENPAECNACCREIAEIQLAALAKRTEHTGMKWIVGLSGGLDSTLALLTAAACRDRLGLPEDTVQAIGMPGFGTTPRTKGNAEKLAEILHVPYRTIPIGDAVMAHFHDIGHDPASLDVVYENAQARERTQVLMDVANGSNGLVLGTGDLSEAALGWCTFNGDHMAMYNINASIPKTLVRHMVKYYAEILPEAAPVLQDILNTPVSPELLPGKQHTEELIGSYELHDFFLYYFIRYGADPETLLALAAKTFAPLEEKDIKPVLRKFLWRFFSQQFKRNAAPDGPAAGPVFLSRNAWQMPSDAAADEWL